MKSLYDVLIEGIPDDAPVEDVVCTHYGAMVYSNGNIGISEFPFELDTRPMIENSNRLNMTLKQLASGVKSWNMTEAAIGQAALNAYYNSPQMAESNGLKLSESLHSEDRNADPFITYQKDVMGKNVVVLGHFPYLEQLFKPVCDLHIIDRYPWKGDFPETAADYLLPQCDYAFIGVIYFIEKSLPHFLELAKNAFVGLVGPVTTLSPALFDYGVDEMDGFVVKDQKMAERITKEQEMLKIYSAGEKVSLRKKEYQAFKAQR